MQTFRNIVDTTKTVTEIVGSQYDKLLGLVGRCRGVFPCQRREILLFHRFGRPCSRVGLSHDCHVRKILLFDRTLTTSLLDKPSEIMARHHFQRNFLKPVCCFQRPLYSSVVHGRTIDQHTRNAYAIFRDDIPAVRVNGRYRVGVCCERSHSSESDASRSGVERPDDGTKLQLFAEELSVTKETLQTGRVLD